MLLKHFTAPVVIPGLHLKIAGGCIPDYIGTRQWEHYVGSKTIVVSSMLWSANCSGRATTGSVGIFWAMLRSSHPLVNI